MPLSNNDIRRLGERLRNGSTEEADLTLLNLVRKDYDGLLIETAHSVEATLSSYPLRYIISGRSKRTKSIIRKLRRPRNENMDLSRMQDIVGLRVIVANVADQDKVVQILFRILAPGEIQDYRNDGRAYRTVHLVSRAEHRHIEIQVRTLPQHLWAVESESFGEQVKEGTLVEAPQAYLNALSDAGKRLDAGEPISDQHYADVPLFLARQPLDITLPHLGEQFSAATTLRNDAGSRNAYIVVFDNEVGSLLNTYAFPGHDRERALEEYHKITAMLGSERYEAVLFNAASSEILQATHPRFFVA